MQELSVKEKEVLPNLVLCVSKLPAESQQRILWIAEGMRLAGTVKEAPNE